MDNIWDSMCIDLQISFKQFLVAADDLELDLKYINMIFIALIK